MCDPLPAAALLQFLLSSVGLHGLDVPHPELPVDSRVFTDEIPHLEHIQARDMEFRRTIPSVGVLHLHGSPYNVWGSPCFAAQG